MQVQYSPLSIDSTVGDIIAHPAFAGFGRLILPWDDHDPDVNMHLRDIRALLPYHSEVNPVDIVTALNRMIDDASGGNSIFYDFYTEAQKKAEPTKRNAGLFFLRGKPGASFAIVNWVAGSGAGGRALNGTRHFSSVKLPQNRP